MLPFGRFDLFLSRSSSSLASDHSVKATPSLCRRALIGLIFFGALPFAIAAGTAADDPAQLVSAILHPPRTNRAALSPDGRYLAYNTDQNDGSSAIVILDLNAPDRPPWTSAPIAAAFDDGVDARTHLQTGGLNGRRSIHGLLDATREWSPVIYLRWATKDRLVYAGTESVHIVNGDGTNDRELFDRSQMTFTVTAEALDNSQPVRNAPPDTTVNRSSRPPSTPGGAVKVGLERNITPKLRIIPLSDEPDALFLSPYPEKGMRNLTLSHIGKLYKLNLVTGKIVSYRQQEGYPGMLYDRQGFSRIAISGRPILESGFGHDKAYPLTFRIRSPNALGTPAVTDPYQDLDKYLGNTGTPAFTVLPENFYGGRAFPLAFDRDPNLLYYASDVGRDTLGIYALDLKTKKPTAFKVEDPGRDLADPADALLGTSLVFDRSFHLAGVRPPDGKGTIWVNAELARLQTVIEREVPGRSIEIMEWDEKLQRILVRVSQDNAPEGFSVFDVPSGRLIGFLPSAPWLPSQGLNATERFGFLTAAGTRISGTITLSAQARTNPPPVVFYLHDIPDQRVQIGFNRNAQALAALGFAVVEMNYRGSSGQGRAFRDAIKVAYDRAPLEDIQSTVDWVLGRYKLEPKRMALLGEGFGGYLAMRLLQAKPEQFKGAVTLNAPWDPQEWANLQMTNALVQAQWERKAFFRQAGVPIEPVLSPAHPALPHAAMLIIQDSWQSTMMGLGQQTDRLQKTARELGNPGLQVLQAGILPTRDKPGTSLRAKDADIEKWDWADWGQAYLTLGELLNSVMFDYVSDIGELKVLP